MVLQPKSDFFRYFKDAEPAGRDMQPATEEAPESRLHPAVEPPLRPQAAAPAFQPAAVADPSPVASRPAALQPPSVAVTDPEPGPTGDLPRFSR